MEILGRSSMELIRTKFVPPLTPKDCIERPGHLADAKVIGAHRVTLARAPAGYGKTNLIAGSYRQLKSRRAITAWLTLDEREKSGTDILRSIAASLASDQRTGIDLADFSHDDSAEVLTGRLTEVLLGIAEPVFIFLDDLHLCGQHARNTLIGLLNDLPNGTHLVIATRMSPGYAFSRLRTYGLLREIGMGELRFSEAEIASVLERRLRVDPDPDLVAEATRECQGWIAGLDAALTRLGKDAIAPPSGNRLPLIDVARFFDEEVLARAPADIGSFLLEASIFTRITSEAANEILARNDSSAAIAAVEELGLFAGFTGEIDGAITFQNQFARFLRNKLRDHDPQRRIELHRRASVWYAKRGNHEEALLHARLSADHMMLAARLEASANQLTECGRVPVVDSFASHLPENVLANCPRTLLAIAWLRIRELDHAGARKLLELTNAHLGSNKVEEEEAEHLRHAIRHREVMLAASRDEFETVEQECPEILSQNREPSPFLRCTLQTQHINARREKFHLEDFESIHYKAKAEVTRSGDRFALISLHSATGSAFLASGKVTEARRVLDEALAESVRLSGEGAGTGALPALTLAEIAYEQNDLEEVTRLLDRYLPIARRFCFADQLVSGYYAAVRLHDARGDVSSAFRVLTEANEIALECDLRRLRLFVANERIRLNIRMGKLDAARQIAKSEIAAETPAQLSFNEATTTCELATIIRTRIATSRHQLQEATDLVRKWRSFCKQRGAIRSLIRWNVLHAELLRIAGETRAAQRSIREAVTAAEPGRLIRPFLDEAPGILELVEEAYHDEMHDDHPADRFARVLLECGRPNQRPRIEIDTDHGLYGHLTDKELAILSLVGNGLRNREIGRRVGMTEGSVKWYMQQIYDKVGVRRRSQAVERVRQFGFLPAR
ncbi:MAG: hypothetical protein KDJ90_18870 [Nitratireductor sp.]|nr:hypothetical protein [Nitratireductor sp.]